MLSFRTKANLCRLVNVHDYRRFRDGVLSFRTKANLCRFVNVNDYRHFCDGVLSFREEANMPIFFSLFVYIYICIVFGDPIIAWDSINRFSPAIVLCLSQTKTFIFIRICISLLCSII